MSEKSNRQRPCEDSFPFITGVIVRMYGFKPDTVRKIKGGKRSENTQLGETIAVADALLKEGFSRVIEDVKKKVPNPKG